MGLQGSNFSSAKKIQEVLGVSTRNCKYSMNLLHETPELQQHELLPRLLAVISAIPSDMIQTSQGLCYAMSDMLGRMLTNAGIRHSIQEVELTAVGTNPVRMMIVGKQGVKPQSTDADTHVVVIVEHEIPILIDLTIPHIMPQGRTYLMGVCKGKDNIVAQFTAGDATYTYRARELNRFVDLYQKSIVERISTDARIFRNINRLYWLVLAMFTIVCAVQVTAVYWRINMSEEVKDTEIQALKNQSLLRDNNELLKQLIHSNK
jgi:hypothetical protein